MKGLETGKDKVQRICDALRKETLEPARQEAREIVENAHMQAADIVSDAQKKAHLILEEARREMEEKKRVFHASLTLACRQGIEQLKQKIEKDLFNRELAEWVSQEMGEPKVIAELLHAFMRAMESQGIEDEFTALIPKQITPRSINSLVGSRVLDKLKKHSVAVGDFSGGVQVRLEGRQITVDISDTAVRELIAEYIRRDFRELVFNV